MLKKYRLFITIVFMLTFTWSQSVYWEPVIPEPGGEITIYYNLSEGSLDNSTSTVYIHLGHSGWQDVDDYAMTSQAGLWSYTFSIPEDAITIDFVFTDLNDNWDNNGGFGIDWHISLYYYWLPYNPGPNDMVDIVLNELDSGGSIFWIVNAGRGFEMPMESYWPEGTSAVSNLPPEIAQIGSWVSSPITSLGDDNYHAEIGPFNQGQQIIKSIKFVIQFEDGSWDSGSNGQVMFYDIYFDYTPSVGDPNIFFIPPTPNDGAEVDEESISITSAGGADDVEYWINSEMIGSDNETPFEVIWTPFEDSFGDYQIAARATGADGKIAYIFLNLIISYNIEMSEVPDEAPDGLTVSGDHIIINLYAPGKEYVAVKGSWNSEYPYGELMYKSTDGQWWYETNLQNGMYTYQFNIEGEMSIADPYSKDVIWEIPNGGAESSYYGDAKTKFEIGGTPYTWNDTGFERPSLSEAVIYELHIGDFMSDGETHGTFADVTAKIESGYFTELGINVIELMPVNEFEGDYSWGYNASMYIAPESAYGSPDDLKHLVDMAHQNDIAVILDVVLDHLWGSSPLFRLYQPPDNYDYIYHDYDNCPYFEDLEAEWQWGYKLNHWEYYTRKHCDAVLYHYLDEYHMDGFRFDYTQGIGWDENISVPEWGANHYANLLHYTYDPSLILIAEQDYPYGINNSGFDAGWDYSYHHCLLANIIGFNHEGHNWGDMNDIASHIDAYGQGYSEHTGQLIYTESHDESRVIYESTVYQGQSDEDAYKASLLGAVILMTSEGIPMIYQGQELGQNSMTSHLDPQPVQWDNLSSINGKSLYCTYENLIYIRKNRIALKENNLVVKSQNSGEKTISYWRVSGADEFVIVANFDDNDHTLNLEFPNSGDWFNILEETSVNIQSNWYNGYAIPAKTAHVLTSNPDDLGDCESCAAALGDLNYDGWWNVLDVVTLANCILAGICEDLEEVANGCAGDINGDGNWNVLDIVQLANCVLSATCDN